MKAVGAYLNVTIHVHLDWCECGGAHHIYREKSPRGKCDCESVEISGFFKVRFEFVCLFS